MEVLKLMLLYFQLEYLQFAMFVADKMIEIRSAKQCDSNVFDPSNYVVHFRNISIVPKKENKNTYIANIEVVVDRPLAINDDGRLFFTLERCLVPESPDSCETIFDDYELDTVCDFLASENEIWTDYMHNANVYGCPIPAGIYKSENITISDDILNYAHYMVKALWKFYVSGNDGDLDSNIRLGCIYIESLAFKSQD